MSHCTAKKWGEKGRKKFTQGKISCWTSPCWWKQCRSGETREFLFLLLLFPTSNTLEASKVLSPHLTEHFSISAGRTFSQTTFTPPASLQASEEGKSRSCFKKSLLTPLNNPSISGEMIMEALEPFQLFTPLIALNIGCKCWKSQI